MHHRFNCFLLFLLCFLLLLLFLLFFQKVLTEILFLDKKYSHLISLRFSNVVFTLVSLKVQESKVPK